ncbi:ribonuclease H-like domain-containing protein [Coprinopsis sp. MPI-PUGE-AT-0042]|nr:ribonuclease H-like domain-containing protein [Coprinopsis sp. MPI-PUGE-AT-0042]
MHSEAPPPPDAPVDPEVPAIPAIPTTSSIEKTPPRPAPTEAYTWQEYAPNTRLVYTRDVNYANQELSNLKPGPLGFDLEWKPNFVKGERENRVALLQLANDEMILLLQLSSMRAVPGKLLELLSDPAYLKIGVGIQGDTAKLFHDWGLDVRGVVDLTLLARTVDNARWIGKYNAPIGLARLVEVYHYRLMEKGKITRSNWEKVLDEKQQLYAANDAYAGYSLYNHLMSLADPGTTLNPLWYSFDTIKGAFWETATGLTWRPHNPNYDPGPPPPPRPPKERKERKPRVPKDEQGEGAEIATNPADGEPPEETRTASIVAIAQATRDRQNRNASSNGNNTMDNASGKRSRPNRAQRWQRQGGYQGPVASDSAVLVPTSASSSPPAPLAGGPSNAANGAPRRTWNRGPRFPASTYGSNAMNAFAQSQNAQGTSSHNQSHNPYQHRRGSSSTHHNPGGQDDSNHRPQESRHTRGSHSRGGGNNRRGGWRGRHAPSTSTSSPANLINQAPS